MGPKACTWEGRPEVFVDHLLRSYASFPRLHGDNVVVTATGFDRPEAFTWLAIQSCLGRDFLVMLKKGRKEPWCEYLAVVLLVGSAEEARRFVYRVQLRGAAHALSWEARTKSLNSLAETVRSGHGLLFYWMTAERLGNGSVLSMAVRISDAPLCRHKM
ncbi:hypothetical protein HPB50_029082 [Hyalomma asiaticum]|nr:hypothetical protein HPB50_029082 [Hyalomma asiaticum]